MELIRDFSIIPVARGQRKADLVLKNGNIINLFSGEVQKGDVAVHGEFIAGIGSYSGTEEIDVSGRFISPGLFDSHVHIESSLVTIPEYARIVVPMGTTSVVIDPHEIANVLGLDGIRYMLRTSKYNPLNVFIMLPSCVPATAFETSGAELRAFDLLPFVREEWVKGLAEVMNFPGVLNEDKDILDKIRLLENKIIDGHSPGLTGADLNGYIAAGIRSDHECTTAREAMEKLNKGMVIMIREGTLARNLKDLIPIVNGKTVHRCLFATDDRHTDDLLREGHINFILKKAVSLGLDPLMAVRMATLNPCQYFHIRNLGAVAPSYIADLVVFDDLREFNVNKVIKNGRLVFDRGRYLYESQREQKEVKIRGSINIKWLKDDDFQIRGKGKKIHVIELVPDQLFTRHIMAEARVKDGFAVSDPEKDIIKCCVVERHYGSDNIGRAFVKGFNLKQGALGSSVAHDSHNIVVIGVNDEDIKKAVTHIRKIQGGFCVVRDEKVLMDLSLPIAGLMSDRPMEEVSARLKQLNEAARLLGVNLRDPFLMLSFLSLPVIPELKVTDKGLFDVNEFRFIDLFLS